MFDLMQKLTKTQKLTEALMETRRFTIKSRKEVAEANKEMEDAWAEAQKEKNISAKNVAETYKAKDMIAMASRDIF
ncbi:hypothetical protein V6N13_138353 [Hibiscus sabdariffa]